MQRSHFVSLLASSVLIAFLACDKSEADSAPAAPSPTASAATDASADLPLSPRLSRPQAAKLVAFGDLHGDLDATRKALRLAGAIDDQDHWIGGELVVVQTGDQIDRGDDDRAILDLFDRLKGEAKKTGGEVIPLSGNHELMNVALDFRYVTPGSNPPFGGESGRKKAFQPGGEYAKLLAERPIFMKVGDSVFVHGGILPKHLAYGLDKMNDEVRAWMLGDQPKAPEVVVASDGPVWLRAYSEVPTANDCDNVQEVLDALGAKRMVVGHTVQDAGITSACEERVWRVDVGMSQYYGGSVQVLEIKDGVVSLRKT